jgi:hypothetical protein
VNRIETHNPGRIADLEVGAGHLVTVDELGVSTWDLSNPDSPAYIDSWYERAYYPVARVDVDERGFAYAGSGDDQWGYYVAVYDLRNPDDPAPISFIPGGRYYDYGIDGHTFVGIRYSELTVVDLTDPFHPRLVCSDCVELWNRPFPHERIAVRDGKAYAASRDSLWVVDLVSESQPLVTATVNLDGTSMVSSSRLVAGDDLVVLLQVGDDRFIDVSDPAEPVVHRVTVGYDSYDAVIEGRSLFVSDAGLVRHFDLADPPNPHELEVVDPDRSLYQLDLALDRLYAVDASQRIHVYDVSGAPAATGISPELLEYDNIDADGGLAIASTASPGIAVFDLADPSTPEQVGHLDLTGITMHQVLAGSRALVAMTEPNSLAVVDVSNPALPQLAAVLSTGAWQPQEVAVSGRIVAVAARNWQEHRGALLLYETSDAGPPVLQSVVEVGGEWTNAVALHSNVALVASGYSVVLVDIANLEAPFVIESLRACGWFGCWDIAIIENRAYVTYPAGLVGVTVVDLTDPHHPTVEAPSSGPRSFTVAWVEARGRTLLGGQSDYLFLGEPSDGGDLLAREFRSPRRITSAALTETHAYLTSSPFLEAVTLECVAPVADFDWHRVGMTVWFDDLSGYGPQSRTWWYGDGLSRQWDEPTPRTGHAHAYTWPGVYDVTLEVSNEWGSDQFTKTIVVTPELGLSSPVRRPTARMTP